MSKWNINLKSLTLVMFVIALIFVQLAQTKNNLRGKVSVKAPEEEENHDAEDNYQPPSPSAKLEEDSDADDSDEDDLDEHDHDEENSDEDDSDEDDSDEDDSDEDDSDEDDSDEDDSDEDDSDEDDSDEDDHDEDDHDEDDHDEDDHDEDNHQKVVEQPEDELKQRNKNLGRQSSI